METQEQSNVYGWQQTAPPPGMKVWVILPTDADEVERASGASVYDVAGPEEVLAVAGYMLLRESRPEVRLPSLHSAPAHDDYRTYMEGVPLPTAAAVLTSSGWYHLGIIAHASEAEAHRMCEAFNENADAGDDEPKGEQTH